ncbi:MAG: FAD-dependent monooxygenase [Eubacteriales bacterium]|nr:FAD-dependent monooxygenase [Eubacteriales bacterium]
MSRITLRRLLTGTIVLPFTAGDAAAFDAAARMMKRVGADGVPLRFHLYRKSVDARRRDMIRFVYTFAVEADEPFTIDSRRAADEGIREYPDDSFAIFRGGSPMKAPPLVVGMGPAGMFAALMLAEQGYRPVIIDRGDATEERVRRVGTFFAGGALDPESNVQFGAGGAGTFSDGKLVTRIGDPHTSYIMRRLCEFGAPEEIMWRSKPHVGTDLLRGVVSHLLSRIEECGGSLICRCRLDGIDELPDGSLAAHTSRGDIHCGAAILATGHSARDTYEYLISSGYAVERKPFSVGVRVEHLCEDIDRAMFGAHAGDERLGHAEYTLSDTKGERGVYTFCMCPGGEVIAAASEEGGVVVNGMSAHARDGRNSNSALAVSVLPSDCGTSPRDGIEYQRRLERAAFAAGGSDYSAPIETAGDFMAGKRPEGAVLSEPGRIIPTYTRGAWRTADLWRVLPEGICRGLCRGLEVFSSRIKGFGAPDVILSGVETRTSAPVRILRGENGRAPGKGAVYPCGEGAGYAGGITSAALDGLKTALAVIAANAPPCGK